MVRRERGIEHQVQKPLLAGGSDVCELQERCRRDLRRARRDTPDSSTKLQNQQIAIGQEPDARWKHHSCDQHVVLEQSALIPKERRERNVAGRNPVVVAVGRHDVEVIGRVLIQPGQRDGVSGAWRRLDFLIGLFHEAAPVHFTAVQRPPGVVIEHR